MSFRMILAALLVGLVLIGCTQAPAPPAAPTAPNYSTNQMNGTQIVPAPVVNKTPAPAAPKAEPPKPPLMPDSNQVANFRRPQLVYGAEQTILKRRLDYRALCANESIDLGTHIITLKKADMSVSPASFDFEMAEERNNQPFAKVGVFSLHAGEYVRVTIADGPDYAIAAKYDDNVKNGGSGCIGVSTYNTGAQTS